MKTKEWLKNKLSLNHDSLTTSDIIMLNIRE